MFCGHPIYMNHNYFYLWKRNTCMQMSIFPKWFLNCQQTNLQVLAPNHNEIILRIHSSLEHLTIVINNFRTLKSDNISHQAKVLLSVSTVSNLSTWALPKKCQKSLGPTKVHVKELHVHHNKATAHMHYRPEVCLFLSRTWAVQYIPV